MKKKLYFKTSISHDLAHHIIHGVLKYHKVSALWVSLQPNCTNDKKRLAEVLRWRWIFYQELLLRAPYYQLEPKRVD
uniref:Uncharacterized protein n=1 Tax=Arion vulgaris TaxID=1028688 RepID=A0A0B7A0C8_9EUPU